MSKLFAALENDTSTDLEVDLETTPEEGEVAAVETEVTEDSGEISSLADATSEGLEATDAVEEVQENLEAAAEGEGLDQVAAEGYRIALKNICARVGADPKSMFSFYAAENFQSASSRKANTKIALESVSEFLKDLWKKIKAALSKLWEKIKAFWDKHISTLGRITKALTAAEAKVKAIKGEATGKVRLDKVPGGLASAFPGAGDVDAKRVGEYVDGIKKLTEASAETSDTAKKVVEAKDLASAVSALKAAATAGESFRVIGGDTLAITIEVDEEKASASVKTERTPSEDKEAPTGFVVATKSDLAKLLADTKVIVASAQAVKKSSDKAQEAANAALNGLQREVEKAEGADAANLRGSMRVLYAVSSQTPKINAIVVAQQVRLAKAVLGFTGASLKQYKKA